MRLIGIGDNVVDRYPDLGTMFPGGNAVNAAVYARRAGARAAYLGVTGDDEAGRAVRRALSAEGVDTGGVRTAAGPNAWAEIGLVDGDRVFKGASDGVSRFHLTDPEIAALAAHDIVHTAYSGSLIEQVPRIARHTRVSFDFSQQRDAPWAPDLVPHLYLAAFSGTGLDDAEVRELLAEAAARGAQWSLVTSGRDGAWLSDGATVWRQPAQPVEAVDTLGAGDAFIGTLLVALAGGEDPRPGLAAAAAAAAGACLAHGGFGHGVPLEPAEPVGPVRPPRPAARTPGIGPAPGPRPHTSTIGGNV
ncbi:PfkB family carbohydrate kinase [Streptomyces sp. NPDC044780]|uniref:PfkB family carbohydrate kinase n=1 Tax=Streptomyces luomodiensis TaxID=3026192 RepID=A0ABY9US42_9ACTN|nr:PfkB family carbohydrate kinase [Streptomyces sp. SCA4-21]WNE95376.1 PfkB family carbohydrate kinase [Streptomyces sp. SCA4-21]